MRASGTRPPGSRDLWIPAVIIAGFVAVLVAAAALSVIAARSDPGLVAGAPARMAGTNMTPVGDGPALRLRVVSREGGVVVVEATLRAHDGQPATAEEVAGTLQRATTAQDDRPVAFSPQPGGAWRAALPSPGPGAWDLAAEAHSPAGVASATLRL